MTCGLLPSSQAIGLIMGAFSGMFPISCWQVNLGAWFLLEIITKTRLIVVEDKGSLIDPPSSCPITGSKNGFPDPKFLIRDVIGDFNQISPENGFVMKNGEYCDSAR